MKRLALALLLTVAPICAHAQYYTDAERTDIARLRAAYDKAAAEWNEKVKQWHREKQAQDEAKKAQAKLALQEQPPVKPRFNMQVSTSLFPDLPPNESLPPQRRTQRILPPVEYDKPFDGTVLLYRLNKEDMDAYCPKASGYLVTLGCAYLGPDKRTCEIKIAEDAYIKATGWTPEIVIRHELGHCNSVSGVPWPKDHPGARPVTQ